MQYNGGMKMADPARALDGRFTYGDYKLWPEDDRWELIGGIAYQMSAPTRKHQALAGLIHGRLFAFLEGKSCKVYIAPFDVLLPELSETDDDDVTNVVQPDVVVFCDKDKLTKAGAKGAPDIAFEVLSPSTTKKDLREKFDLFQRMGVREYWLIDPAGAWINRFNRNDKGLYGEPEVRDPVRIKGKIPSLVLEGFAIDPEDLFAAE
jgi:Uma2 family endonuclease